MLIAKRLLFYNQIANGDSMVCLFIHALDRTRHKLSITSTDMNLELYSLGQLPRDLRISIDYGSLDLSAQSPNLDRCASITGPISSSKPIIPCLAPSIGVSSAFPHDSFSCEIYEDDPAASTAASAFAVARFFDSPCLPFYCHNLVSARSHPRPSSQSTTHLPLRDTEIHLSSALGSESLVVLQASAHDAAGDGEVAVVTVTRDFNRQRPADLFPPSHLYLQSLKLDRN